jgi:hypothetical protein
MPISAIRNYGDHAYYMQVEWDGYGPSNQTNLIPRDSDGNRFVYFNQVTDSIGMQADDVLEFGGKSSSLGLDTTISGTITAIDDGVPYVALKGEENDGSFTSNSIRFFQQSMHWVTGWNRPALAPLLTPELLLDDPYKIEDATSVAASTPVDIIKQLLGDRSTDVGVPRRSTCTTVPDLFGITGERQFIDWDTFETLVAAAGLDGASYQLDIFNDPDTDSKKTELSIRNALNAICMTHGIRQVWEYNEAQRGWWMTFKPFTGDSVAQASNSGRTLSEGEIVPIAGGEWIFGNIKASLRNDANQKEEFTVEMASAIPQHAAKSKSLKIDDKITILPAGDDDVKNGLAVRLADYLENYSQVHHVQKFTSTLSPLAIYSVGGGIEWTWQAGLNRQTGLRGVTSAYGEILGMTVNLGSKAAVQLQIRESVQERLGIAPSMIWTGGNISRASSVISVTGLASTQDYVDPVSGGLTDLAMFDCYYYSVSEGAVTAKSCSCGDYAVWIFKRDEEALTDDGASRNVWSGTIGNIDITAGTADITLDATTNFDTVNDGSTDFVVIFADRDSADLQTCQSNLYGWLGDASGETQDSAAATHKAIVWA